MDIITTKVKEESLLLEYDSQDMREMSSKELVNKVKSETLSSTNYYEIDVKREFEEEMPVSNIYSQNETKYFLKDAEITSSEFRKGYEMDTKIEIKEEVCWLERSSTETPTVSDESKAEMNESFISADPPSLFIEAASRNNSATLQETNLPLKTNSAECELTRICESQESVYLEKTDDMKMSDTSSLLADMKQQELIQENKKSFKCDICFKEFTKSGYLSQHKLIHGGKRPFKCDICCKSFTLLGNLKTHKLIHNGEKPFKCDICCKSFTLLGNLKTHKLIHKGEKSFECDICCKSFTLLGHLKRHKLIHEGKKSYRCEICCKSFTILGNLKRHKLIHEDKKPFKCETCCKSFTRLGHLKTHKLIHEDNKPFKCEVCCKSFTRLGHLKRHKLIHKDKMLHKCDICYESFTQLAHLKTHTLIHMDKKSFNSDVFCKSWEI